MATGKTEVGRALARRFRRPMVDADDEVESRAGKSVAIIFSEDGEEAFRVMEKEVIRDLCLGTGHVSRSEAVHSLIRKTGNSC